MVVSAVNIDSAQGAFVLTLEEVAVAGDLAVAGSLARFDAMDGCRTDTSHQTRLSQIPFLRQHAALTLARTLSTGDERIPAGSCFQAMWVCFSD